MSEYPGAPVSCQEDGNLREISSLSSGSIVIPPLVRSQDLADQLIIKARDDILRRSAPQEEQGEGPSGRAGYIVEMIIDGPPQAEPGSGCHEIIKQWCLLAVPPPPDLIARNLRIDNHQRDLTGESSHKVILAVPHTAGTARLFSVVHMVSPVSLPIASSVSVLARSWHADGWMAPHAVEIRLRGGCAHVP